MGLFQEVEGEAAVLIENGVYKQVPVFKRNGYLYAKIGSGFVRLYEDGSTTKSKCRLDTLTWGDPATLGRDSLGKLCFLPEVVTAKPLPGNRQTKLLGAPE